jgi:GT2 family glycosyltransferase
MEAGGITVAVLAHNAASRITECLNAILEQTRAPDEIVVIDNGSEDATAALVECNYPSIRVIRTNHNTGCSGGRNRQLTAAGHRYVMIVDDDAILERSCLEELTEAMRKRPDASIWSPRVCYEQNRGMIQFDGVNVHYLGEADLINPDRRLDGWHPTADDSYQIHARAKDEPVPTEPFATRAQGGVAYLLDKEAALAIGGFDESFFFGRSDGEFSLRLHCSGRNIYTIPTAVVFHRVKKRGFKYVRQQIRNRWMLILVNYSWRSVALLMPAFLIYECSLIVFLTAKGRFRDYLAGNWQVVRALPAILEKRRVVQGLKQRRDRDILSGGFMNIRADVAGGPIMQAAYRALNRFFSAYWSCARFLVA